MGKVKMVLSEDQVVVDALKGILENDYPYLLEYDEIHSSGKNHLIVKKVGEDLAKGTDSTICRNIIQKLQIATGRWFYTPGSRTDGLSDSDKNWHRFLIKERR